MRKRKTGCEEKECVIWEKAAKHTNFGERQNPSPKELISIYAHNTHMHMYTCGKDQD